MDTRSAVFESRVIDDAPVLLEHSYRLRYQVYCLERQFLRSEAYPQGRETDEFDRCSVHVGAIDRVGGLAGTARLIQPFDGQLPTLDHGLLWSPLRELWGRTTRVVEASRLSVSRGYGAHAHDVRGLRVPASRAARAAQGGSDGSRGAVFLAVLKALYHASKALTATHWIVATERSLQRLLSRQGFPFRQIGPEFDYFGMVAPYALDLAELDQVIVAGRYPDLDDFAVCDDASDDHAAVPVSAHLSIPPLGDAYVAIPPNATVVRA